MQQRTAPVGRTAADEAAVTQRRARALQVHTAAAAADAQGRRAAAKGASHQLQSRAIDGVDVATERDRHGLLAHGGNRRCPCGAKQHLRVAGVKARSVAWLRMLLSKWKA